MLLNVLVIKTNAFVKRVFNLFLCVCKNYKATKEKKINHFVKDFKGRRMRETEKKDTVKYIF
jgi:hypothetical protein